MDAWEVQIDNFTDAMLNNYGWYRVDTGPVFSKFYYARYDEYQPIMNAAPRFIILDDYNDVLFMQRDGAVVKRCPRQI